MISTVVESDALEGHRRLDAEYYQPVWADLIERLTKAGAKPLAEVASIATRPFVPDSEVFRYIEISRINTRTGEVEPVTLAVEDAPSRAQWRVEEGDVLFSTVRPLRNAVCLIDAELSGAICSSGFAVLRPTDIEPEVLFAYLKAPEMAALADRYTTATMYPAISRDDLLKLPVLPQDTVSAAETVEAVRRSQAALRASRESYREAESEVLAALNWNALDLTPSQAWTVELADVESVARLDAEHFDPRFARLREHLDSLPGTTKSLDDLATSIQRGSQPRYVEGGDILVVNSEHVGPMFINTDQAERTDQAFYDATPRARCQQGDILFNSTGLGSIGRANIVMHEAPTAVDNHVAVIHVSEAECDRRYLSVFLNSEAGQLQTACWLSGSSGQIEIYPKDIKRFRVALPDSETQKRVGELVTSAYEQKLAAATALAAAVAPSNERIRAL